jgi:hypothetical protein
VFGDDAAVLDADGAREEEHFGDDLLAMSARAAGWATSCSLAAVSQMTIKPRADE